MSSPTKYDDHEDAMITPRQRAEHLSVRTRMVNWFCSQRSIGIQERGTTGSSNALNKSSGRFSASKYCHEKANMVNQRHELNTFEILIAGTILVICVGAFKAKDLARHFFIIFVDSFHLRHCAQSEIHRIILL